MKSVLLGIVAVIVLLVIVGFGSYNGLVGKSQSVDAAWADVANQYQRRADLIPNLVKTVQGSADFEKSTLNDVISARASVGRMNIDASKAPASAEQLQQFQDAQNSMSGALQRLLVVVERYPDLKASAGFQQLQAQLEGTENRIGVERKRFNDAVRSYNTAIKSIPGVFFAGMLGFHEKPYFKAAEGAEKPPEVEFNFNQ